MHGPVPHKVVSDDNASSAPLKPPPMTKQEIEELITGRFAELTPKIQAAARRVLDNPKDIALRSMRSVAAEAGLQPASMLRLARELGFENYEAFRTVYVDWLSNQDSGLVRRAERLRSRARSGGTSETGSDLLSNELANLEVTLGESNDKAFKLAARALSSAQHVYIVGLRSMYAPAFFLHYVCAAFRSSVTLVSGLGGTFADELRRIGKQDVVIAFSAFPYTAMSVDVVAFARERSATVIAVSDSKVSPVALQASITILAPNGETSLFPSILPATAVAHVLGQIMIIGGGEETLVEVANSEAQLQRFKVYTS